MSKNAITYARPPPMKTPVGSDIIPVFKIPDRRASPFLSGQQPPPYPGQQCIPRIPLTISSLIISITQEQLEDRSGGEGGSKGEKDEGEANQTAKANPNSTTLWDKTKLLITNINAFSKQALPAHVDVFLTHLYSQPTWSTHRRPLRKLSPGTKCTLQSPNNRYHEYKITGQTGTREGRLILSAAPRRGGKTAFIIVDPEDYSPLSMPERLKAKICKLMRIRYENPLHKANDTKGMDEKYERETSTHTWSE
ncbi:hypothetical protein BC835DRAFT_1303271 [Cytidiella melzeri]|nr:hypothetical protein BC835DRAFT_1303271 [Cytidiella melzeri]